MQKICNATECLWAPLSINLDDDDVEKYKHPVTPLYKSLSGFAKQRLTPSLSFCKGSRVVWFLHARLSCSLGRSKIWFCFHGSGPGPFSLGACNGKYSSIRFRSDSLSCSYHRKAGLREWSSTGWFGGGDFSSRWWGLQGWRSWVWQEPSRSG